MVLQMKAQATPSLDLPPPSHYHQILAVGVQVVVETQEHPDYVVETKLLDKEVGMLVEVEAQCN